MSECALGAPEGEGRLKRGLRAVGQGLLAAAEESAGLTPEIAALIRAEELEAEAERRDLSDIGILTVQKYPHQHGDLLFLDAQPGAEPNLT